MPPLPLPSLEFRRIADISPSPLARAQISSGPILGLINRVCFDQMRRREIFKMHTSGS